MSHSCPLCPICFPPEERGLPFAPIPRTPSLPPLDEVIADSVRESEAQLARAFEELERRRAAKREKLVKQSVLTQALWSAFCVQWVAVAWCMLVGKESP